MHQQQECSHSNNLLLLSGQSAWRLKWFQPLQTGRKLTVALGCEQVVQAAWFGLCFLAKRLMG